MPKGFHGWKLLLLLCLANMIAYIAVFELPPIIGNLAHDFRITYAEAGLFMSVYAFIRMIGSLMAGTFSDRYGVKYFVLAGLALLTVAGFLCALSPGYVSMLIGRTLIGIGATCVFIPGLAASMSLLGPDKVNFATGTFFTSMNLGLTIALLCTPILAAASSWRLPLNLFAVAAAVVGVIFLLLTRGDSLTGASPSNHAVPSRVQEPAGKQIALGEYSLRNLSLLLVSAGYFLLLFQSYGMITWLPEYLKTARGYSPAQVGSVSSLLGLILIPGTFLAGWLGDRVSAWGVALLGAVLCGACPAILIMQPNLSLAGVFFDVFLLALGTSFLVVPLTSILTYLVPGKDSGKAVGLVHTTGYAGSIASTYLGGYLLTAFGTYTWPFALFAACMAVMVLLLLSLKKAYSVSESMRKRGLMLVEQPTAFTQRKAG